MIELSGIRGVCFDFIDDPWKHVGKEAESARFFSDGLLVIEGGIIKDFGAFADISPKYPNLEVTQIKDRLILPGFIDGHTHFPQTRVVAAFGQQLLGWLEEWIFPEELKYTNREYAQEGADHFFDGTLAAGTTTCQAFTTSSPVSTEVFFEEATRRNMRVIAGLTGIDRFAPDNYRNTPEGFYHDSEELIRRYHRKGRNLYAITPRFAYGCSPELMEACRRLKLAHMDCWVNTHISENPTEIDGVLSSHPDCNDYLSVYEKYKLTGRKFSGGHGVWLSNDEFRRLSASDSSITFCPCSNLFLGSGLFRLGRATDPECRVKLSFGTDIGAGNRFSMLNVLDDGYKVGMCNNTLLDGSIDPSRKDLAEAERNKLSPYRGFWSITLGGAEGLVIDDKIGNFDIGKEADFVALDWNAGPPGMEWHQSTFVDERGPKTMDQAANLLFSIMMMGDDRCVDETWIMGKRAYKKGANQTMRAESV
jgi:guanine deaminase